MQELNVWLSALSSQADSLPQKINTPPLPVGTWESPKVKTTFLFPGVSKVKVKG